MKLENWSIGVVDNNPYQPPELQRKHLHGKVFGNHNFNDGDLITTSAIVRVEGEKVLTASGSIYELGEVNPEYEKAFPNARQRLFGNLQLNTNTDGHDV